MISHIVRNFKEVSAMLIIPLLLTLKRLLILTHYTRPMYGLFSSFSSSSKMSNGVYFFKCGAISHPSCAKLLKSAETMSKKSLQLVQKCCRLSMS